MTDEVQSQSPMQSQKGEELLTKAQQDQAVKSARSNDLRRLIGILFTVYGVIVTAVGIIQPGADVAKTGGIPINLWTGIGMLIVGIGFLLWNRLRPLPAEDIIASAEASARKAAVEHEGTPQ